MIFSSKSTSASRTSGAISLMRSRNSSSVLVFVMISSYGTVNTTGRIEKRAEGVASGTPSASCYDSAENIRILAVVMAKGKLVDVQRQVVCRNVMERPNDTALQQCPKSVNALRMDFAAHVLTFAMVDGFMREALFP